METWSVPTRERTDRYGGCTAALLRSLWPLLLFPCTHGTPTRTFVWSTNGPWTGSSSKLETEAGARARHRVVSCRHTFENCPTSGVEPGPGPEPGPSFKSQQRVAGTHHALLTLALCTATTPPNPVVEGHVTSRA